eukprot:m.691955 g.691955  ORF g.691955 m.691955 type:complete len:857 (+) comp22858_c0_seq1:64-2634(+)
MYSSGILVLGFAIGVAESDSTMNSKPYTIANPLTPASAVRKFRGEYFEMYGSWQTTRYADVDWHPDPVPLPSDIIKRFDDKVMAITGYEVNIVRTGADGSDELVSTFEQYNHHYSGFMTGKNIVQLPSAVLTAEQNNTKGSHGDVLPVWGLEGACDMSGTWYNPSNKISVSISPAAPTTSSKFQATCIGPVGWHNASIKTFTPTGAYPQGSAELTVYDSNELTPSVVMGYFNGTRTCSRVTWTDGNTWFRGSGNGTKPGSQAIPNTQAFSEGNGNEHRVSYKGYANGVAQLIHSPTTWTNNAMIINTNKRLTNDTSPGPMVRDQRLIPRHSIAPPDANYAGILECPCTTRLPKILDGYMMQTSAASGDQCSAPISSPEECQHAATVLGLRVAGAATTSVKNASLPPGCITVPMLGNADWSLLYNDVSPVSHTSCGAGPGSSQALGSFNGGDVAASVVLDTQANTVRLTMACVANGSWFGVGLNATSMSGAYAIVVDGTAKGAVTEHRLGNHQAGTLLPATVTVLSNTLTNGLRTVVMTFPLHGSAVDVLVDASGATSLPVITAVGTGPTLAYHKEHTVGSMVIARAGGAACVCRDPSANSGTIAGARFNPGVCAPFPVGELQTTHNAICNITEYNGGLFCCHGGVVLLDADQQQPAPVDKWRMKYRFYFEEYTNQSNLFRSWWSTEAYNNEYDVPKSTANCLDPATPPEQCVHTIRSNFTGRDFVLGRSACMVGGDKSACADVTQIEADGGWFRLMYAAFHCHAPACISGELWNMDTGELLCRNTAQYGTGSDPMDEEGYVVGIPPCVWGTAAEGLHEPPKIHLDTNLTTIKHANSTNGHWGVMALWQSRIAYASG